MSITNTSVNPGRSLHGCWTCRLRRKKCDETRPFCSVCTSLELGCQGYGSKPEWMDNGTLQRQETLKVKQFLSIGKTKRRKRRSLLASHTPQELNLPPENEDNFSSKYLFRRPIYEGICTLDISTPEKDYRFSISENCSTAFNNSFSATFPFDQGAIPLASSFSVSGLGLNLVLPEPHERAFESVFASSDALDAEYIWENAFTRGNGHSEAPLEEKLLPEYTFDPFHYDESLVKKPNTSGNEGSVSSAVPSQMGFLSTFNTSSCFSTKLASPREPIASEGEDDSLFMHYLDHVFYIQYPFYGFSPNPERGWLFSILRRSKSAYHAVLALSERHQNSMVPQNRYNAINSTQPRDRSTHYDLALREMQLSIDEFSIGSAAWGLEGIIEALTCILQLLFLELFCSKTDNWKMHLRAAKPLISTLLDSQMPPITLISDCPEHGGQQNDPTGHNKNDTAIKFLLGSFISFDIISCASIRCKPFLEVDHLFLLESTDIQIQNHIGCENWVMIQIFKVSQLDTWKKDAERSNRLSIVELVNKGARIEAHLQKGLADITNSNILDVLLGGTLELSSVATKTQITHIFAHAALTYLHVVISGANPELPEIKESVSATIGAFKNLPEPTLLRNLVWPFCVTGCLALEEQYGFFRGLISAAQISESTIGTCMQAFKIMGECWETRKASSWVIDWAWIMVQRDHHVLLR